MPEEFVKIVVFAPIDSADVIRKVIGDQEAGVIGNYSHASFSSRGVGRFIPQNGSNPAIGTFGKLEEVEEERIEVICAKSKAKKVVGAIKKVHPYEEPAIEIYLLISAGNL